jgi:hypothetical protein
LTKEKSSFADAVGMNEKLIRVCACCDKESGIIRDKVSLVSHGYCKRHAYEIMPISMHSVLDKTPESYFIPGKEQNCVDSQQVA